MIHTHTIIYKKHTHTPCLYLQKARKRSTPHTQQCANKLISKQNKELCNIKHKHSNPLYIPVESTPEQHTTHTEVRQEADTETPPYRLHPCCYICASYCVSQK